MQTPEWLCTHGRRGTEVALSTSAAQSSPSGRPDLDVFPCKAPCLCDQLLVAALGGCQGCLCCSTPLLCFSRVLQKGPSASMSTGFIRVLAVLQGAACTVFCWEEAP